MSRFNLANRWRCVRIVLATDLGNFATVRRRRGQGLATAATARLCQALLQARIERCYRAIAELPSKLCQYAYDWESRL